MTRSQEPINKKPINENTRAHPLKSTAFIKANFIKAIAKTDKNTKGTQFLAVLGVTGVLLSACGGANALEASDTKNGDTGTSNTKTSNPSKSKTAQEELKELLAKENKSNKDLLISFKSKESIAKTDATQTDPRPPFEKSQKNNSAKLDGYTFELKENTKEKGDGNLFESVSYLALLDKNKAKQVEVVATEEDLYLRADPLVVFLLSNMQEESKKDSTKNNGTKNNGAKNNDTKEKRSTLLSKIGPKGMEALQKGEWVKLSKAELESFKAFDKNGKNKSARDKDARDKKDSAEKDLTKKQKEALGKDFKESVQVVKTKGKDGDVFSVTANTRKLLTSLLQEDFLKEMLKGSLNKISEQNLSGLKNQEIKVTAQEDIKSIETKEVNILFRDDFDIKVPTKSVPLLK